MDKRKRFARELFAILMELCNNCEEYAPSGDLYHMITDPEKDED